MYFTCMKFPPSKQLTFWYRLLNSWVDILRISKLHHSHHKIKPLRFYPEKRLIRAIHQLPTKTVKNKNGLDVVI